MPIPHLLAADDPDVLRLIQNVLSAAGYRLTAVRTGVAANAALMSATVPFDGVVMDNQMPGMTGVEVLTATRWRGDRTPVLIISGRVLRSELPAVFPPAHHLAKPFQLSDLLAAVSALIVLPPLALPPAA